MKQTAILQILLIVMIPLAQAVDLQGPPIIAITDVALEHGAQTTIRWTTPVPANSLVEWGPTPALGTNLTRTILETTHSAVLSTTPGETYYYTIKSCDAANLCATTAPDYFVAGPFFVRATIPAFARGDVIDVVGQTRDGAEVEVIVNDNTQRKDTVGRDFTFRNIALLRETNTIRLVARKDGQTATATYTVAVDTAPPRLTIDVLPAVTTPTINATVTVNEPVTLTVTNAPTATPLSKPRNLTLERASATSATITWTPVDEAQEYVVYRNGKRVGSTSSAQYIDDAVGSGKNYQYQATSISEECAESEQSDILFVTTQNGQQQETIGPVVLECEIAPIVRNVSATTSLTVTLRPGENYITFNAVDAAGYTSTVEERVVYDTGPPEFLTHNLAELSPSYTQDVVVRGQLSEQGSVTVFVNDKPQKTQPTDDQGNFAIPITLERPSVVRTPTGAQFFDEEVAWTSKVKLSAVDGVGLTAETNEFDIKYAICGTGGPVSVTHTAPLPSTLNPRLLMQGFGQAGFAFEYEYTGGYESTILHSGIRMTKLQLAPSVRSDYDHDILNQPTVQVQPVRGDQSKGRGYVQLQFQAIDDPETQLPNGELPNNATDADKEKYISKHRRNDCLLPGLGCVRLFLELEIPYQETILSGQTEPAFGLPPATINAKTQKVCFPIELAIDQSFRTTDLIPSKWLAGVSKILTELVNVIDDILKPIETIGRYLFYACTGGTFASVVPIFLEKLNCDYKHFETVVTGGAFDPLIAEIGACAQQYAGNSESLSNCNACQEWKLKRKQFDHTYRQVCDRIACPSAPSLQSYLKRNSGSEIKEVAASDATKTALSSYLVNGKLYAGNDCAAFMQGRAKPDDRAPSLFFSPREIQDVYSAWLKHKDDTLEKTGLNCNGLHPANPECCGYAYVNEWGSACGVTALAGLDTFDEIKESTCLSAQKIGENKIIGLNGVTEECNNLANSVSGFCDSTGGPPPEPIRVVLFSQAKLKQLGIPTAAEQNMHLLIVPQKEGTQEHRFALVYMVETFKFNQANITVGVDRTYDVTSSMKGIELDGSSQVAQYFTKEKISQYHTKTLPDGDYVAFQKFLCEQAGYTAADCGANGRDVYERVMAYIGTPDKEYIINPRQGLVNNVRCMCFPALTSQLKQWRDIMKTVRACVDTIATTGDGSAGQCQALISKSVCDVLHEALACFTQKFSSGSEARGFDLGNIFSALTSAGNEMQRSVRARYGDAGLYKSLFVDQKLTHSMCMFAFTGTWNFNIDAAYDKTVNDFPIESQGFLMPCERRFQSFNPFSQPPGLVNWLYTFGFMFAPGSDVDLRLKLQCSGGYNCKESDGFENGKCDCDSPQEITISPPNFPSRLAKGQIVTPQITYLMQGTQGPGQIRYDKAYIEYNWRDGNTPRTDKTDACTITQSGGSAGVPEFCRFFAFPPAFRCQWAEGAGAISIVGHDVNYEHDISEQ